MRSFNNTVRHQTLPYAIQKLQAAGYTLVTLAECLGKEPYQYVNAPQAYNVRPFVFLLTTRPNQDFFMTAFYMALLGVTICRWVLVSDTLLL